MRVRNIVAGELRGEAGGRELGVVARGGVSPKAPHAPRNGQRLPGASAGHG
jgi:hypothetical protein